MNEDNFQAHPLFAPRDDDDEAPIVEIIQVFRIENGSKVMVPKHFSPTELLSEEQIYEKWGGGTYELIARGPRRNGGQGITAKRGFTLPGPPKPLYEGGQAQSNGQAQNVAQAIPIAQQAAQQNGTPSWLPIMATLMPILLQWLQGQQESSRADRQASQALLTAMMKQSQDANAQMMTLMATLNRPVTNGSADSFKEGMSFMQDFITGQIEQRKEEVGGNGEDDILKSLSQVAEMVNTFMTASDNTKTVTATEIPEVSQ